MFPNAASVVLQAGLVYRAIEVNMRMLRWEHALELAAKHNAHVDTVLFHRQQYLRSMQRQESDQEFLRYAGLVTVDADAVRAKEQQEMQMEAQRMPVGVRVM